MTRSVWKGPFVDGYVLAKADAARDKKSNAPIKIWSLALDDPAAICGADFRRS